MKALRNKKVILAAVLILGLSMGLFADAVYKDIRVTYKDISLVIDNQKVNLGTDSAGDQIEPFIYNGTTYLPVRAVGEALGKEVAWDGNTSTVYIGKREGVETIVRLNDDIKYMSGTDNWRWNAKGGKFIKDIASNEYSYYLYIDPYLDHKGYIAYPTNGEYSQFRAKLGWDEGQKGNSRTTILKVFADDKEVLSTRLGPGEFSKEISADISGALKVTIEMESASKYIAETCLFDPVFVK